MALQYIPDIGASGIFVLKTPFDVLLKPNTTYTVQAIRRLKDVIAEGENPFTLYYESHGLSEAIYKIDLETEICIVSLQSGTGEWVYVPTSYILSFPIMNGVKYHAVMMGISLGAIPDNLDLSAFKTSVFNLVKDTFGISSSIKEVVVSAPVIVTKEESTLIETARSNRIVANQSDAGKLRIAQQDLVKCRAQIAMLEKYIKDNHV